MAKWLAGIFAALVLLAVGAPARGEEQILSFLADITVEKTGALLVSETIEVNAEGNEIRRGIFRDIPLRSVHDSGLWDSNGIDIVAIEHNGEPSKYFTEWHGRFLRIYVGEADVVIPYGVHTYRIAYRTTRQLRRFPDYDEVYWNATGNFWSFPILEAEAIVRLPQDATASQQAAYTGRFGESGRDYSVVGEASDEVRFFATRRLEPGEGLTVAVGFTKGVVAASDGSAFLNGLRDNLGMALFAVGWPAIAVYFLWAWARVGRDPPGETVIPLFHPPENLPPDAMSFIHFRTFKGSGRGSSLAFIAALLSLGVKKALRIDESDSGEVSFERGEGSAAELGPGERELYVGLLASRQSIALTKANGTKLLNAMSAQNRAIRREYGGKYFSNNYGWFFGGAVVAIVVAIGSLILQAPPDDGLVAVIPGIVGAVFGCILLSIGWNMVTSPAISRLQQVVGILFAIAGLAVIALLGWWVLETTLPLYKYWGLAVLAGGLGLAVMFFLLPAPTELGAKVMSRIEGFKLYLTTAETNRLNLRGAPRMSEELFERYLPYAAGLGVEEPWSKAFSAHLARTAPDQEREYKPAWYRGRDFTDGISNATRASVAAVSAAMVAAMPAPKSSSGSSGGGFSGGGGGGGGGGGW